MALHVLKELGEEEHHAVHPGIAQAPGHIAAGAHPTGEEAKGQDRFGGDGFDPHEQTEQNHRQDERRHGHGRTPPRGARLDQAEDQGGHAGGRRQGAGQVESAVPALGLVQDQPAEEDDGQADGDVHEHHPPPRRPLGEQAAGHQAEWPLRRPTRW